MKLSNCFSLYAVVSLALAAITLPGIASNVHLSTKNASVVKKVQIEVKAEIKNAEDVKTDLLFRF